MISKYGIDFGTTNSSIAVRYVENKPSGPVERTEVIELMDRYPYETVPSSVCICEDGNIEVGMDAYVKLDQYEKKGKKAKLITQIKLDLESHASSFTYRVGNRTFDGTDLIAAVLRYLRERAEPELAALNVSTAGVVMGVPVQFGDIQKNILKEALVKAGYYRTAQEADLKTEFDSEPVAVAVHHGLNTTDNKTVMVFDFGGGTLDLAVVNLRDQVGVDHLHPHEVKAKDRRTIGGELLTKLFFTNIFCSNDGYGRRFLCRTFGFNEHLSPEELWEALRNDTANGVEFIDKVEQCKCELSNSKHADFSFIGTKGIVLTERTFHRTDFEDAISSIFPEIEQLIDNVLAAAKIDDNYEIDHVLIAGGSSLIPCIQEILTDRFGKKKVSTQPGAAPKKFGNFGAANVKKEVLTSVVRGLAAIGCKDETIVEDVVDNDYGIWFEQEDPFYPVIPKGTPIKQASLFDKASSTGPSVEAKCQHEEQTETVIKIYQRNLNGLEQLGTIYLDDAGGKKYRIFMHIDKKQGMLVVNVYDRIRKKWFDIPQSQSKFEIKIK